MANIFMPDGEPLGHVGNLLWFKLCVWLNPTRETELSWNLWLELRIVIRVLSCHY